MNGFSPPKQEAEERHFQNLLGLQKQTHKDVGAQSSTNCIEDYLHEPS